MFLCVCVARALILYGHPNTKWKGVNRRPSSIMRPRLPQKLSPRLAVMPAGSESVTRNMDASGVDRTDGGWVGGGVGKCGHSLCRTPILWHWGAGCLWWCLVHMVRQHIDRRGWLNFKGCLKVYSHSCANFQVKYPKKLNHTVLYIYKNMLFMCCLILT